MSSVMDDLVKVQDDSDYCTSISLLILPTELLVMILSYLSTHDIISIQFVSKRFKEISETPSLWRKFAWPDYEPDRVTKILKMHGEHARQIFFPAYVRPVNILEITHLCPKLKHLSIPLNTQLSLDHLEEIIHTMTHLEQLDMFISSICYVYHENVIKRLLKVTTGSVRSLTLKFDWIGDKYWKSIDGVLHFIEKSLKNNHPLPSVINLLMRKIRVLRSSVNILECLPPLIYTRASLEIGLYYIHNARVPMNLYPSIPYRKFRFGPAAKPSLIKLSDHGILGLDKDIFCVSDYYNCGKVRLSVSCTYSCFVNAECLHCISNFHSVTNFDFSGVDINSGHLEQLAIACPNLEQLNLYDTENCLQSLQGLRAIADTCKNLQGLNLAGICVPVESNLLLWELLSSIRKLTHLALELCMLIHGSDSAADRGELIGMLTNCNSLKALEITEIYSCKVCDGVSVNDLLLSHFPYLVHVRLFTVVSTTVTAIMHIMTNCHQLKYFYYDPVFNNYDECYVNTVDLPLSISCHLQQLCLTSRAIHISVTSAQALSAHGGLEQVSLFIRSITINAITTLISNSPNLILLHIVTAKPLHNENGTNFDQENYKDTVLKAFPDHKLLTIGELLLTESSYRNVYGISRAPVEFITNCNSFWDLM